MQLSNETKQNSLRINIKDVWLYNLNFVLVAVIFFLPKVSNKQEVLGLLRGTCFIISIVNFFFYLIIGLIRSKREIIKNEIIKSIFFYFLSEITFLIIAQDISLFGISYKWRIASGDLSNKLILFRYNRNLAFSTSFLVASILFYFEKKLYSLFRGKNE